MDFMKPSHEIEVKRNPFLALCKPMVGDAHSLMSVPFPHKTCVYFILKRTIDIVFSCVLIVATLPVLTLIAIIISIDSPGPILIRQKRVGYKGVDFVMYKLRTMHSSSRLYDHAPKHHCDNRITRVGKVLRRTSVDELPQLINVLNGSMTLVGPRPEMRHVVDLYKPWQMERFNTKPGLTGFWQVSGRKDLPLLENIEYDLYYLHHRSTLFDCVILIKTVAVVLGLKGAY
jgi:lipopolysaccharide/colanic/teichoic acid biosynthesis glycosyltransferase